MSLTENPEGSYAEDICPLIREPEKVSFGLAETIKSLSGQILHRENSGLDNSKRL